MSGRNLDPGPPVHVALAILEREDKYLFQLRDNIPGIVAPGQWALFGGHLEKDELPEVGLRRELEEEIKFQAGAVKFFGEFEFDNVIRHIFITSLHVSLAELVLGEGQEMRLLAREEILSGVAHSTVTGKVETIAPHIQNIFKTFLAG